MAFGGFILNQVLKRATKGRLDVKPGRVDALMRLPTLLRLGYALFRDERVPLPLRGGAVALLALIFSPLDVVGDIPVIGQFWDFTLSVVVLEYFIKLAPANVVNEHIVALGLEKKVPLRRV
jgi:uncharacterized membrane protein YkvA (DUF1232 family)